MEDGFRDYQSFTEEGVVSEEGLPVYGIAKRKLEQYRPFEEELVRGKWMTVIEFLLVWVEMKGIFCHPLGAS